MIIYGYGYRFYRHYRLALAKIDQSVYNVLFQTLLAMIILHDNITVNLVRQAL